MAACAVDEAEALTLLRRLTRWAGFAAERDTEPECCLAEDESREKLPDAGRAVGVS